MPVCMDYVFVYVKNLKTCPSCSEAKVKEHAFLQNAHLVKEYTVSLNECIWRRHVQGVHRTSSFSL